MTSPIDTIREALNKASLGMARTTDYTEALAALTQVEQQLAAPCRCDKCRDCVAADGYEAAEQRANDLERAETALAEAREQAQFAGMPAWTRLWNEKEAAEQRANELQEAYDGALDRLIVRKAQRDDLADALRQIADPTNHHHKPGYVTPEQVARAALDRQEQR